MSYEHFRHHVDNEKPHSVARSLYNSEKRRQRRNSKHYRESEALSMSPRSYWNPPPKSFKGTPLQWAQYR